MEDLTSVEQPPQPSQAEPPMSPGELCSCEVVIPLARIDDLELVKRLEEAKLQEKRYKYSCSVKFLMYVWERYAQNLPRVPPEDVQPLMKWAYDHTLPFLLRMTLETDQHLQRQLVKNKLLDVAKELKKHGFTQNSAVVAMCAVLANLADEPWEKPPALVNILHGKIEVENEEEFCRSEGGDLLMMRLIVLIKEDRKHLALRLAAACVRWLRRSGMLRCASKEYVQYMFDVHIVLLFEYCRKEEISVQLRLMDLKDGLELIRRLRDERPSEYERELGWRTSTKAAEYVAEDLAILIMARPFCHTDADMLEQVLISWLLLHSKLKDNTSTLPKIIRELIDKAETSSQHIYFVCSVLMKHFGDTEKPLVVELYIRALIMDIDESESQQAGSDKGKAQETDMRVIVQSSKLRDLVANYVGGVRECFLRMCSLLRVTPQIVVESTTMSDLTSSVESEGSGIEVSHLHPRTDPSSSEPDGIELPPSPPQVPNVLDSEDDTDDGLAKTECHLHPRRDPSTSGPDGYLCCSCGEFTGIELPDLEDANVPSNTSEQHRSLQPAGNRKRDRAKRRLNDSVDSDSKNHVSGHRGPGRPRKFRKSDTLEQYGSLQPAVNCKRDRAKRRLNDSADSDSENLVSGHRGPGRPRKFRKSDTSEQYGSLQPAVNCKRDRAKRRLNDSTDTDSENHVTGHRGPGRPRKFRKLENSDCGYNESPSKENHPPMKKRPGRPRKEGPVVPKEPRGRGRPLKNHEKKMPERPPKTHCFSLRNG